MASLRSFQWWALAAALGVGCTVNHSGLSLDGGPGPSSGSGGSAITADGAISSGGAPVTGSGGNSGTGGQVIGSGGAPGTGGSANSGGAPGTGGVIGSGGYFSMGGNIGSGGRVGSGGVIATSGGAPGSGGVIATSGGAPGSGGQVVSSGGMPGSGGASNSGGAPGTGGRAGTGGRVGNCTRFPDAMAFNPPNDDHTHCYWFRSELKTWQAARMQCMNEMGGDLVSTTSAAENDFVRSIARFTGEFPQIWLGATDDRPATNMMGPGTYHWVTNEAWGAYTNWNQTAPKQPDGFCDPCSSNQSCTCDHRGTMAADGTWYDFYQETPRAYVCEALATAN